MVLFAIVLIYVAIMAIRLSRIERELGELLEIAERSAGSRAATASPASSAGVDAGMSELLALGISHKTAPVALRERLAFTEREAGEFALEATATAEVREAVVISTCNRTEVYLVVGDPVRAESDVLGLLARRAGIRPTELAEAIYSPRNCDAARQLYRVTAGLESMIVGEAEIQGQVRRAHEAAMRGRLHRTAVQPPVRRRADDRASACARRPRSARAA